jgi:tetratricopeptide (TPR) repeat protein
MRRSETAILPAITSGVAATIMMIGSVLAQPSEMREQLIRRSLEQLHDEQFDSALANCAAQRRLWPEDPAGYLNGASIYQTMMRDYRVRLFEAQFDSLINRAVQLAERQSRRNSTAENLFALGLALGYQALHRFHRGEWSAAFRGAVIALNAMDRALAREPDFIDPALALALYEYWKSVKLDFGLGIFSRKRKLAISLLEKIWKHGRYVSVEAAYSLQIIYLREGDEARALEINTWLYERFPRNPGCLYHRALILEKLERHREALEAWEKLMARIHAFGKASDGFLAECHLHRALLYEKMNAMTADESGQHPGETALKLAAAHAQQRDAAAELEGPLESFETINREIARMLKKYSPTPLPISEVKKP